MGNASAMVGAPDRRVQKQMTKILMLALALLALAACDDSRRAASSAGTQASSLTMPPMRMGACLDSALVDEKCTAAWYSCSADRSTCSRQWTDCCRATTSPN